MKKKCNLIYDATFRDTLPDTVLCYKDLKSKDVCFIATCLSSMVTENAFQMVECYH